MCTSPTRIKDPNGNQKDDLISVACRKCLECRASRSQEWTTRMTYELKEHKEASFITLTYAEKNNTVFLVKKDLQKFIKRLREKIKPKKIKYFSCGEYGDRELRPHFHIIIFGESFADKKHLGNSKKGHGIYRSPTLEKCWDYGFSTVQDVTPASISYCTLYTTKYKKLPEYLENIQGEFNTMSQGLGNKPIYRDIEKHLKNDGLYVSGQKKQIPLGVIKKYIEYMEKTGDIENKELLDNYLIKLEGIVPRGTKKELDTRNRIKIKKTSLSRAL